MMTLIKEDRQWVDEVVNRIEEKLAAVSERSREKIPSKAIHGIHDDRSSQETKWNRDDGLNWWTNGFWGGMMWLLYEETKEDRYKEIARISEEKLDQCFVDYYGLHHDVGFMWLPTAVADYRLTGNQEARKRGMHAANLLAGRFNPVGNYIRAWNDIPGSKDDTRGWAIIDCMFNIPLLYWASEESGDPRFGQIAMLHADTVRGNFIREDGSSEHIVEFDPFKGGKVKAYGGQGYADGSAWTRGQTWALYGFVISYKHTYKPEYLETAQRVADYFLEHIPDSGLIPVDFMQPAQPAWEDSIAAAVAACGFLELAKEVDTVKGECYKKAAIKLLKTLDAKRCDWSIETDGILQNCTGAYHNPVKHENLTYGDFYFMEAMWKLHGNDFFIW